jgi:hypothetical protein
VEGESSWFLFEVMEMLEITPAATIRPEFRTLNLNPRIYMEPYTARPYVKP